MKKTSYSILAILGLVTISVILLNDRQNPGSTRPSDYDELKKADKPELYLSLLDELKTKPGQSAPDYPVGYRFAELAKAKRELAAFRTEANYEFIERGPTNVPGRTRGLLVDPDDPTFQTWFAGGVGGGIWKTIDGGQSWQNMASNIPNLSISWIVMAESNHDILYAGTGEGWGGSSNFIKGNGILKSTDHGETWLPLDSTTENPEFEIINRLVVDPTNPDIVLAATSTDRRFNPDQGSWIFKSLDGGLSWQKKYTSESYVQQIITDPYDFSVQYAAESGIGVIKSIDAGETWNPSSEGMVISRRVELAVSPVNTDRLYASAQADLSGTGTDLYFSDDAGATWALAVNESGEAINFLGGQGWYDNTILAHPFNLDEVYVGGVDFWKFKVSSEVIDLGNKFVGADEENLDSFFTLLGFNSGVVYDNKIVLGDQIQEDFVSVEIRFGPDGQGDIFKQMAHRFTVPDGRGSGVDDAEYSYEDYVEVPFQVWDIKNDRQLMVAFRDQQKDGIFNLLEFESNNDVWQSNSREYLYISNLTYNESAPDVNIAVDGGHVFDNLYFMWPFLPENGIWEPQNFPASLFRIRFKNVAGTGTEYISLADSYNRYDGPNSFSQTTGSTAISGVHPDHHNIAPIIHDTLNQEFQLVIANDGGIYSSNISTDPGTTEGAWDFSGSGYNTAQFYAVDKAPGESRYVGGLQDNGTWMTANNQDGVEPTLFKRVNGGDGFGTAWNYADKSQILSTLYFNRIEKSNNEGGSSPPSTNGLMDVGSGLGPFVTELEYFQADPDVVYTTGISGVWKSEDFGDNWTLAPIDSEWRLFSTVFARISHANPNIVWAGTGMSTTLGVNFHVSTDAGESFLPVTNFAGDLGRASGFATHPLLDSTAFALFSYAKSPKILRTDDLGQTWYDITGFEADVSSKGFPDVSVRDLLVMPNDTSVIWAGTEIGIFESTDSGDSWHLLPGNLPAVPVWDMKIVDKEVVLGSHGRGIWSIELEELTGHVYLPELISAMPSKAGEPIFRLRARSAYDSAILFVNDQRTAKVLDIEALSYVEIAGNGVTAQSGDAYIRAFRDGRPFVSKRFAFEMFTYPTAVESYTNDFDAGQTDDFIGNGFSVTSYAGFAGRAIHSTHHYEDNAEYIFTLKQPIKVRANEAFINFSEIAIVEPGADGAVPGTPEFKDYVVVQGSVDGVNWLDLIEPYDATARALWPAYFGPVAVPVPDILMFRAIDLQNTFNTDDEIIIRFVLRSDNDIAGWGWLIDNLKIQTESVIASLDDENIGQSFNVYPNPVTQDKINISTRENINEFELILLNSNGQVKIQKRLGRQDNSELSLPASLSNGVYILMINSDLGRETHKLIIDR